MQRLYWEKSRIGQWSWQNDGSVERKFNRKGPGKNENPMQMALTNALKMKLWLGNALHSQFC